jgi:hypothetical protein
MKSLGCRRKTGHQSFARENRTKTFKIPKKAILVALYVCSYEAQDIQHAALLAYFTETVKFKGYLNIIIQSNLPTARWHP